MELKGQAIAGARWTSVSTACTTVTEISRAVVLAHFLAPVDFGLMGMVMIVIGIGQTYVDLGISAAIIHRQDATREQLSSLYWLNVMAGLAVVVAIWLMTPWVALAFREPRIVPILHAVALVFLIAPLGAQFEVQLQKELSFRRLALQEILVSVTSFTVGVACAAAGLGVWALVYAFLSGTSLKTLLLLQVGLIRFRPLLRFRRSDLRGFVGFGAFQLGERTINFLAERLDQILIGGLLGARALGLYNFAVNLTAQPIWRINPVLTRVAFPVFARVQHDTEKLRKGYLKLVGFLTTVNAPLLLGLAAVAPMAIPLIFSAKWSESIFIVQLLCLVALGRTIGNPIGSLQLAKGRADLGFWWNLLLFVASVPAVYIGARFGGAVGVAAGLLVLQLVLAVPSYLWLVRPLVGECGQEYARAALVPFAAAAVMAVVVFSLGAAFPASVWQPIQLAVQILVGAVLYVGILTLVHRGAVHEFRSLVYSRVSS